MSLLPDTLNNGLHTMRVRHVRDACAVMHAGIID